MEAFLCSAERPFQDFHGQVVKWKVVKRPRTNFVIIQRQTSQDEFRDAVALDVRFHQLSTSVSAMRNESAIYKQTVKILTGMKTNC